MLKTVNWVMIHAGKNCKLPGESLEHINVTAQLLTYHKMSLDETRHLFSASPQQICQLLLSPIVAKQSSL